MSLERLGVKGNILHPVLGIAFINFFLTMVALIMSTTIFARPSGVELRFPAFGQETGPSGQAVAIKVSGENVIYVNNRAVTLNELRRFLAQGNFRRDALTIEVDRRASMGRVSDILDLCRGIAGANVHVSTIL